MAEGIGEDEGSLSRFLRGCLNGEPLLAGTRAALAAQPLTCQGIRRLFHAGEWHSYDCAVPLPQISNVIGCLYVDSKTLRNQLIPITQSTLDSVKTMLLGMARESCVTILTELQGYCKKLNERPEDLDEFMAYQVFHARQAADKIEIIQKASVVDDMYDLLQIYDQKVRGPRGLVRLNRCNWNGRREPGSCFGASQRRVPALSCRCPRTTRSSTTT